MTTTPSPSLPEPLMEDPRDKLIRQAIQMIGDQDMCKWSDAHDKVTLEALRDARASLAAPSDPVALTDEQITKIAETLPDPKYGGYLSWAGYGYRKDADGKFKIPNVPTYVVLPFAHALLAAARLSAPPAQGAAQGGQGEQEEADRIRSERAAEQFRGAESDDYYRGWKAGAKAGAGVLGVLHRTLPPFPALSYFLENSTFDMQRDAIRAYARNYALAALASMQAEPPVAHLDDAFDCARAALLASPDRASIRHVLDVLKTRVLAAPAAQQPTPPVAWSGWACQYPGKLPRLYGAREIAEVNLDEENDDRLLFLTSAPAQEEAINVGGELPAEGHYWMSWKGGPWTLSQTPLWKGYACAEDTRWVGPLHAPAALATPPVASDIGYFIRDCCEAEPADPDHADTICISRDYLEWLAREHFSTPPVTGPTDDERAEARRSGLAAHGLTEADLTPPVAQQVETVRPLTADEHAVIREAIHDSAEVVHPGRMAQQVGAITDEQIAQAVRPLYASDEAAAMGLDDDIRTVRAVLATPAQAGAEGVGRYGFSRDDLEAIADGLDGYERTVNVGNTTGVGDTLLESTTAAAARFIRAVLSLQHGADRGQGS